MLRRDHLRAAGAVAEKAGTDLGVRAAAIWCSAMGHRPRQFACCTAPLLATLSQRSPPPAETTRARPARRADRRATTLALARRRKAARLRGIRRLACSSRAAQRHAWRAAAATAPVAASEAVTTVSGPLQARAIGRASRTRAWHRSPDEGARGGARSSGARDGAHGDVASVRLPDHDATMRHHDGAGSAPQGGHEKRRRRCR